MSVSNSTDEVIVDQINRTDYELSEGQVNSWTQDYDKLGINAEIRDKLVECKRNTDESASINGSDLKIRYDDWNIGMNVYVEQGQTKADLYITSELTDRIELESSLLDGEFDQEPSNTKSVWEIEGLNVDNDGEYQLRDLERDIREVVKKLENYS